MRAIIDDRRPLVRGVDRDAVATESSGVLEGDNPRPTR
jgi:hypothetical protein